MRFFLVLAASALAQPISAEQPPDGLASLRPLLQEHCYRCHSSTAVKLKASLRLDRVSTDLSDVASQETWRDVLKRIETREMPPKGEPRLADDVQAKLVAGVRGHLAAADARRAAQGRAVLRRLNRVEYENTLRDL